MRALGTAGLLGALLCCATPKPPPQAAATPAAQVESCPVGPVGVIPAEFRLDTGDRAGAVQPQFASEPFAPPSERGKWRFLATGCLAASEATETQGERYPPRAFARAEGEAVRVLPVRGGAIVEHDLTHACCLAGDVVARVDGRAISLVETLTGTPCRCLCESTLRTAIALPGSGRYELVVRVAEPAGEREAFRGLVEIP